MRPKKKRIIQKEVCPIADDKFPIGTETTQKECELTLITSKSLGYLLSALSLGSIRHDLTPASPRAAVM